MVFAFICLCAFAVPAAFAQNPVSWTMKANAPRTLKANDKFSAQVTANIEAGWHLYSISQPPGGPIATRISVVENQPFKLGGGIKGTAPKTKFDPNFQINTETYESSATFNVPIVVAADATAGQTQLNINVRFQACTDETCLPPKTIKLNAPVELIAAATLAPTPSPTLTPTPLPNANLNTNTNNADALNANAANANANLDALALSTSNANGASETSSLQTETPFANQADEAIVAGANTINNQGATAINMAGETVSRDTPLSSFLWLAITFGALSLLTPCVFPMIPITVSYFTNHAAGNRQGAVRDAVIYALGIILTFTALGVALAVVFGAAGINRFAANPYINLLITFIFLAFAFSLLGSYNLGVPSGVLTRLDAWQRRKEGGASDTGRIVGLLLMGLTFSLTSFTCTAPFVGTLLVMASQGDWIYPVVGMLAFSTVFALPFFILALAPQLVSQLPRSGGWLNSVKVVMGLLEIAAAMKFLSNVDLVWGWGIFTREVVLASWVAISLLIALYLLGVFQLAHDTGVERIGAARLMFALISFSLGFYLLTGLFGARLGELESFLPPATASSNLARANDSSTGELDWITNDYAAALAQAKRENKPLFIDFTGYTCTNCRWMEANMFPKPEVRRELEKFVRLRLYTDGEGEPYEGFQAMQQHRFGTVALPLYVAVSPDDKPLATFAGLTRKPADFVSFLRQGQSSEAAVMSAEVR